MKKNLKQCNHKWLAIPLSLNYTPSVKCRLCGVLKEIPEQLYEN